MQDPVWKSIVIMPWVYVCGKGGTPPYTLLPPLTAATLVVMPQGGGGWQWWRWKPKLSHLLLFLIKSRSKRIPKYDLYSSNLLYINVIISTELQGCTMGEMVQTLKEKTVNDKLIPHFSWRFFAHPLPDIPKKTISRKLPVNETYGLHVIYSKFRVQVMGK